MTLLAAVALSAALAAAQPAPKELLERAKQATGGPAWDRVKALRYETRLEQGGKAVRRESWVSLEPARYVLVEHKPGGDARSGFDGVFAWREARGMIGLEPDQREARTAAYMKSYSYLFPERWPAELSYLGTRTFQGRAVEALRIVPEGGSPVELELDRESGEPLREVYPRANGAASVAYGDRRETAGLRLPSRADAEAPGSAPVAAITEAVEAGPEPEADRFRRPALKLSLPGPVRLKAERGSIVRGLANGAGPFPFALDTGGYAQVAPALARAAALSSEAGLPVIRSLELGELKIQGLAAPVMPRLEQVATHFLPGGGPVGLLGLELFLSLAATFEGGQVVLAEPSSFEPPRGWHAVPLEFVAGKPAVDALADGKPFRLVLDTGSNAELVLRHEAAGRAGLAGGEPLRTLVGTAVVGGRRARVSELSVGPWKPGGASVVVLDAGAPLPARVDGLIGLGLLLRRGVAFDYSRRRAYLAP